MSDHTPEPWRVVNGVDIQSGPTGVLAYVSTAGARGRTIEEARANAARIVDCVNACAGTDPPRAGPPFRLLTPFEVLLLNAFYAGEGPAWEAVSGPDYREHRRVGILKLVALGLLAEEEPWAFRITHAGHTLIDNIPTKGEP